MGVQMVRELVFPAADGCSPPSEIGFLLCFIDQVATLDSLDTRRLLVLLKERQAGLNL